MVHNSRIINVLPRLMVGMKISFGQQSLTSDGFREILERCATESAAIKAGLEPCHSGWFAVGWNGCCHGALEEAASLTLSLVKF